MPQLTSTIHYSVRVSSRAKRARIEVNPLGKVQVVVPKRFNLQQVPDFVAHHRQWLDRTLRQLPSRQDEIALEITAIELRAVNESWQVRYQPTHISRQQQLTLASTHTLLLDSATPPQPTLQHWLQQKAKHHLQLQLDQLSDQLALPYHSLSVKQQKTRWGSCSSKGNINLNRNLLFLPPELVDYLLIHELCHTVHLNHSPAYWQLVKRCLPDYLQHDSAMRRAASQYVPWWALSKPDSEQP